MGIGGAGVSGVAAFAKNAGYEISGCDSDTSSLFLKPLQESQVEIFPNHDPEHLNDIDILVVSPAIESLDPNNPEVGSAKEKNIPVVIGEKFLAENILTGKKIIAVSGVHGKSTTTAMLGKILEDAGLDPSVMVGAIVESWEKNYRLGGGELFVLEADEYQEKFLLYRPFISVITAVEMDHPEYFKDLTTISAAFQKFAANTTDSLVVGSKVVLDRTQAKTIKLGQDFEQESFKLKLIGDFNQENANLAFEVAKLLGVSEDTARASLENFTGVGRRFEFKGEEKGVKVFDDYAHHPTAIEATARAAREKFPQQHIWLIYQPHMYSRTKYLEKDFVKTFQAIPVDQVILVDIFAARQENTDNITSADIVQQVNKPTVRYIGDFEKTANYLAEAVGFGDIVLVVGAGDIYKLSTLLLEKLKNHD